MKYYDMHGFEITKEEWEDRFDEDTRKIGETTIGKFYISTVWLGVDYGTEKFIYETVIFNDKNESVWLTRYRSLVEAIQGHLDAIDIVVDHFEDDSYWFVNKFFGD